MTTTPPAAQRARDLGVPFDGTPGRWNAITDVPGVQVGYTTIVDGAPGEASVARTGVTAILPRGARASACPAPPASTRSTGTAN
ncbi:hypothetical protein GCM10025870_13060 [Agromyces marinus]|uniref:S58 family peptidase n=1 Tax=Agromyces marinus TaxID=1389020 RepID=A0ABN6YFP2_9MICO|nr:P1 family peptidase [Agromyces marinus]BDZ54233.1 hypothetical protein GCM10025870_13060 [Agromyces marinus]